MNLAAVMDEVGARLDTLPDLNVYPYPADKIVTDAAVIDYPDSYPFDATARRGSDEIVLPVWLITGRVTDKATKYRLTAYCDGSGSRSIKQLLETGSYTSFGALHVPEVSFDAIRIASVDYMGAMFPVQIVGLGA